MGIESGTAVPRSAVSVQVTVRSHTLLQDKTESSGGKDEGPMASEFLLASVLACQHSTFVKVAAKRRVAAAVLRLDGDLEFQDGNIVAVRVRFTLDTAATDEQVGTLLRLTDKSCTISRALKVPVEATFVRTTTP